MIFSLCNCTYSHGHIIISYVFLCTLSNVEQRDKLNMEIVHTERRKTLSINDLVLPKDLFPTLDSYPKPYFLPVPLDNEQVLNVFLHLWIMNKQSGPINTMDGRQLK